MTGYTFPHSFLDYLSLTKPRIVFLLLVTTFTTMFMAAQGRPPLLLSLWTLLGGALAAGAANAINCYLDRDIDAIMARTRKRPLPAGRLKDRHALWFGVFLSAASFVVLALLVNLLSALLAVAGIVYYDAIYTAWLKRRTPQNIVIGGAAGAIAPLLGWSAVTGRLEFPAFLLSLIIFLWTPPHFWSLALNQAQDYQRAGIPMLPAISGEQETSRQIVLYTFTLVPATLLLYPFEVVGKVYFLAALLLNGGLLFFALNLLLHPHRQSAWRLFYYSNVYLALLFLALVVDRLA
ncbi:MAG: heme o synthase [Armatimonadota bacterium]|nr:heme o synthase [Armatimonadota bacterium]